MGVILLTLKVLNIMIKFNITVFMFNNDPTKTESR